MPVVAPVHATRKHPTCLNNLTVEYSAYYHTVTHGSICLVLPTLAWEPKIKKKNGQHRLRGWVSKSRSLLFFRTWIQGFAKAARGEPPGSFPKHSGRGLSGDCDALPALSCAASCGDEGGREDKSRRRDSQSG